jgi:hypothetical protein
VLKHIVIEHPKPGCIDKLEAAGAALQRVLVARGLRPYNAWRAVAPEAVEPGMFDVGFLSRATMPANSVAVFECVFESRAQLEAQLHAVRNDAEAVKIMVGALDFVDRTLTKAFILEDWHPEDWHPAV